jgi:uncharacterized protein YecE (DUF72 family)
MGKASREIRVGTSGWFYDHWRGKFYPDKLAKNKWFEHYAQHFDTVELNNTFYRLPKEKTVENWRSKAPKDFVFVVKANRYITHIKRLKDTAEEVKRFFDVMGLLGGNLGPVLYQLPPSLQKDFELLESFVKLLPSKRIAVFEFRHKSWYEADTLELLDKHGVGFCVHDMAGKETSKVVTGNLIYVRFHGTSGRYSGNYTETMLRDWAKWISEAAGGAHAIYAYFNNDIGGHAINNAKTLRSILDVP